MHILLRTVAKELQDSLLFPIWVWSCSPWVSWWHFFDGEEFQSPDESNCNFIFWRLLCPTKSLSSNSAPDNWILTALSAINGGITSLIKCLDLFQTSPPFLYTLILVSCPHVCMCNSRQECCPYIELTAWGAFFGQYLVLNKGFRGFKG